MIRSTILVLAQFRTEKRFPLFLELLWRAPVIPGAQAAS